MIVKIDEKSSFMQYMTEANEPPRKNMKVVTLKTHDGRRPDYTSGAEINDDEAPPIEDEPEEAIPAADDENQDFTDGADGGEDAGTEPEGDDGGGDTGDEPVTDDDQDFTDGVDDGGDAGTEPEGDDDGGDTGDEPVTDDDQDFTDGVDDGGDAEDGGDDENVPSEGDSSNDEDNEGVEAIYKYNLYQKFEKLLTTINDYLNDLQNIISDDAMINYQYKELTSKLTQIKDLMSDYMVLKFKKVSFAQSMLFYQRVMTSINIILDTLKRIRVSELKSKT